MNNGKPHWTGKVELIEDKLLEPLRWRKSRRVFVNSMSDLFHEALPYEAIDRVFAVMALCPQQTFMILTKRAERMCRYFSSLKFDSSSRYVERLGWQARDRRDGSKVLLLDNPSIWPLPNVWLGVSTENQKYADERIPWLLKTPAAVRFISYEPALGPVDFTNIDGGTIDALSGNDFECLTRDDTPALDWIIAGGESGPNARPAHPDWFRSVRDQCAAAGVPFFFKQWGKHQPVGCADSITDDLQPAFLTANIDRTIRIWPGGKVDDGNEYLPDGGAWFMESVGKKAASRLLDGREHNEFPQ